MIVEIATVACGGPGLELPDAHRVTVVNNTANRMTPCDAYQGLMVRTSADILIYAHDDVTVHDPDWLTRITKLFDNPNCVAAGLGGATSLGRPDLYKRQYRIEDMARGGYASNQTDAETHGDRFTGDRRVAVLDAFVMAVRVAWLRGIGGWPVAHLSHHCLDLWLACEAARRDREVWMTGALVTHYGGGTSTKKVYADAGWLQGGSLASDHQEPHRWLAREYMDCLPIEVRS